MSEAKRDDEPTMEEILASIRKIISEDDPEAEDGPDSSADASASAEEGAEPMELTQAAPEDPEPMELTQMVSEDGSVVDLSGQPAESPVVGDGEDDAVPLVPEGTRVHAELVDDDSGIEMEIKAPEPVEPEPEPEPVEPEPEPEPEEPEPEQTAEEPEPEPEEPEIEIEEPEPETAADQPEPEPAVSIAAEIEPEPEPAPAAESVPLEQLISSDAAAAATAAMARLNDSLTAGLTARGPIAANNTLEALVREAMAPHLKSWLDENLPELVERIVREEIEKLAKRASSS